MNPITFFTGWFFFAFYFDAQQVENLVQRGLPRFLFWPTVVLLYPLALVMMALVFFLGLIQDARVKLGFRDAEIEHEDERIARLTRSHDRAVTADMLVHPARYERRDRAVSIWPPR